MIIFVGHPEISIILVPCVKITKQYYRCILLKSQGNITDAFYVVENNIKIASACVNHRSFLIQKSIQKLIGFGTMEVRLIKLYLLSGF